MAGFQKAEKKKVKLKLGITGPSGAGKTYSALRLAKGLSGRTAVIDTENGSASLYSDRFDFDVLELTPPFTTAKYMEAIRLAVNEGYDNCIIDSMTHAWSGDGGILDRKDQKDARGGNSFTNWSQFTKEQGRFMSDILQAPINIVATIRSKQAYELITENNKTRPQKMGLKPEQREGLEYEFTCVFDVAMNHQAEATKDRTSLFIGKYFQITEDTAKEIKGWLESGVDVCGQLLSEVEEKLKGCPEDVVERVGAFLDKDGNDKNENALRKTLKGIDVELAKVDKEEVANAK